MSAADKIVFFFALMIQLLIKNGIAGERLIFSQIVYRHGDRAIMKPYPNDPNKDESRWPEGFGQLSNLGKMQLYELGEFFRARYAGLLGNGEYSSKKVFIQSSDADRAIQSAAANSAGFFPPTKKQRFKPDLNWQPIPAHTIPTNEDIYLAGHAKCKRFDELLEEYRRELDLGTNYKDLLENLTKNAGLSTVSMLDIYYMNDVLSIEKERNMTLPQWANDLYYPGCDIQVLAEFGFTLTTATPAISRLKFGHLLRRILDRFDEKIKKTLEPNRVLWIYSAHDITIVSLLNILGLHKAHPPYAAALMFELYESRKGHHVKLYYRTSPDDIQLMEIPKCGVNCTLENYNLLFKDSMPDSVDDWKKACEN